MKPVILLAFANDNDNYLPMIRREGKSISKSLRTSQGKDYFQVYKEDSTTIEDIFELFTHYKDQVAIFHYGGHANGTHLQLENSAGKRQKAHAE